MSDWLAAIAMNGPQKTAELLDQQHREIERLTRLIGRLRGCGCEFGDDGLPTSWCLFHSRMRDENERLKSSLANVSEDMADQYIEAETEHMRGRESVTEQSRCQMCEGKGSYLDYQPTPDGDTKVEQQCEECGGTGVVKEQINASD